MLLKTVGRARNVIRTLAGASVLACASAAGDALLRPASVPLSADERTRLDAAPDGVKRWRMAWIDSDAIFSASPASDSLEFPLPCHATFASRAKSEQSEGSSTADDTAGAHVPTERD